MTVIVGILCKDGVVIGADSAASFDDGADFTIEQPTTKIDIIHGRIIVAGTGAIGLGQRFKNLVKKASDDDLFAKGNSPFDVTKTLTRCTIDDFVETYIGVPEKGGEFSKAGYGALLAFPLGNKFDLCEFPTRNFQPELKDDKIWFVSMGRGQKLTDPFLGFMRDVFWKESLPTRAEGIFTTVWAIQHAIDLNTGGINGPVQIAELALNKKGDAFARILENSEIGEHYQNISEAKKALKNYKDVFKDEESAPDFPIKPG